MHLRRIAALVVILAALGTTAASAQSDVLLRLRSGTPLSDRMRVDSAGSLVATGELGYGVIPAFGCGWRMMWYVFKGAFRAGSPGASGTCNQWDNDNIGFYSWAGGYSTTASGYASFAFGDGSSVSSSNSAAFGGDNSVTGQYGFATGYSSTCSGTACVAMGYDAAATGQGSVALGYRVSSNANYSVVLGQRATANGYSGAFVFADASNTGDSLRAFTNNSFTVRAASGARFYTNSTNTAGVTLSAGGGSWNTISDRARKEDFEAVDEEEVLLRLRDVPVSTWRYISEDAEVRHMGPVAQDWHAAFGLSPDSLTINSGDFDGVNLAAIRALERRTTTLAEELARERRERAALERRIAALEERLADLEAVRAEP